MRTSWLIVALIVLATAGILVPPWLAGGSGSGTAPNGKIQIGFTVWGMPFEDRLYEDRYARGYERINPYLSVDYHRYGDDLVSKYRAWHALGEGKEVMRLPVTDYMALISQGILEPLTPYINDPDYGLSDETWNDIPPHLRSFLKVNGQIYALPEDNSQYGLFYNRTIFDEYNAKHPDDPVEYPSPKWNWDDLRNAARKLTTWESDDPVHGRIVRRGLDFSIWSWPFITFFAQAGGELWSDDGLTCKINSPAGVETLEYFRSLQRDVRCFVPSFGQDTGVGPENLFATGQTAMYLDGSWRVPFLEITSPDLDFAVSPLPHGKKAAVVSGCVLWCMSSDAKHKLEGWKMIKWLIQKRQALEYWDTLRVAPPARLSVIQSDAFKSTHGIPKPGGGWEIPPMPRDKYDERAKWILYANTPDPKTGEVPGFVTVEPYESDLDQEIQRMLEAYLNPSNNETAQTVLDRAVRNVHAIIDRDRAAKGLPPVNRSGS